MREERTDSAGQGGLPFLLSEHMKELLERLRLDSLQTGDSSAYEAVRRQVIPSPQENTVLSCELPDPLGSHRHAAAPRLIHQYRSRCLLLAAGRCFAYCRHCFRRCYMERQEGFISDAELDAACEYLAAHPEVQEILCSGGDPLIASDSRLETLFERLRRARPGILLRVCTRAPLFAPSRFTSGLTHLFRRYRPLWLIPHINHPAEVSDAFSPESVSALASVVDAGIPVQSQTVLLKGVNDSAGILADLFHRLACMGIKPGYLFQADLAPGTSHLRVPVRTGLALYEELRARLSGLSCPVYAVDLPDGGGKFNLLQLDPSFCPVSVVREEAGYLFSGRGGKWFYPA